MAAITIAVQQPRIQTAIVNYVTKQLEERLKTHVTINSVNFKFFKTFQLNGIYIEDQQHDTILYANSLNAEISLFQFRKQQLIISDISLDNARIKVKRFKGTGDYNFDFIIDAFSDSDTTATNSKPWDVELKSLRLNNNILSYQDLRYMDSSYTPTIDFDNVLLTQLNIEATDFKFYDDSTFINIKNISGHEKSGFVLDHFTSEATFCGKYMQFNKLQIKTAQSDVKGVYRMDYDSMDDFDDYIKKVRMHADIQPSKVSSNDVQYFAEELFGLDKTIDITGFAKGTVDLLQLKKLDFSFGNVSHFKGNVSMNGLPDLDKTYFDIVIDDLVTDKNDIESVPQYPFIQKQKIVLPDNIALLNACKIKGKFTGFISDFVAYGNANTGLGTLSSDINLKTGGPVKEYSGHVSSSDFDIGKFIGTPEYLGKITMSATVKGQGFKLVDLISKVDGTVSSIEFNKYAYKNITVNGEVAKKLFKGALAIDDRNVKLKFDGSVDYTKPEPLFNCNAAIASINLPNLNLIDRDSSSNLHANAQMNFSGDDLDNALGTLKLSDLTYSESGASFHMDTLNLDSYYADSVKHFNIASDFVDSKISGISRISTIVKSIEQVVSEYFPVGKILDVPINRPEQGNFTINIKNLNPLLGVFYPDLTLAPNSIIEGDLNTATNQVNIRAQSHDLVLHGIEFNELTISGKSVNKELGIKLKAGEFLLNDSLTIKDFMVNTISSHDSAKFIVIAHTQDSNRFFVDLGAKAYFKTDDSYFSIDSMSRIIINSNQWYFNDENRIRIDDGVSFENFRFFRGADESLSIDGKTGGKASNNELHLVFKNFELEPLNNIFRNYEFEVGGITNGTASYSSDKDKPLLRADLSISTFRFFNDTLGDAVIKSNFDIDKNRINVEANISGAAARNINIDGYYEIGRGKQPDNLHFDGHLKRTSIASFQHYFDGLASDMHGLVTADLQLRGTPEEPLLTGKANFQKTNFTVDYLNTHYSFTDEVTFNEKSISFNDLTLYDSKGHTAKVNGNIFHNHLTDFKLDFQMLPTNFMVLNTNAWQNDLFYGTAYATGKVDISGPLDNIYMNIALASDKGTLINLPLSTPEEVGENGYITFVKHDTISRLIPNNKSDLLGMNIDLDLTVNTNAEIKLIFDSKIGDIITGQGNGDFRMQVQNDGTFNLFGGYTIEKGSYYFTMQNLIGKYFELVKGGTIKWFGDPYEGLIDLQAKYTKNAGLYDLLQDTSAQYKKKIPVEVLLSLKNKLFNPDITFDINVPGVDATTSTLIQRYLNTEEEKNKQAMSIIVFNKFTAPSSIEGNSAINSGVSVGASLSEFVTQQLSNWASQISSDFNIDFNYTPGDVVTNQQIDVAVSTKVFNDRVKLTGTVGYGSDASSSSNNNTSTIIGDFLVEADVSKDGRFKVKAFNKSNQNTLLTTNNAPYTQGVGWTYRKEFDKFGDLFRRKEKVKATPTEPVKQ